MAAPEPTTEVRDQKFDFLAVLVFDDGEGWVSQEPRVYHVSHPEIAYRLAICQGQEARYGRTFLGLAHLEQTDKPVEPITESRVHDARLLLVEKSDLMAIQDPRWRDEPWNEEELAAHLREPPLIMELEGLETIPWGTLTHAYGSAVDVPVDLRRLSSCEPAVREQALSELSGSIYHQGTIYPVTAFAIHFLFAIARHPNHPMRSGVLSLLAEIAAGAGRHPQLVRKAWADRRQLYSDLYRDEEYELLVEQDLATHRSCRVQIRFDALLATHQSSDPELHVAGENLLRLTEEPVHPIRCGTCTHCRGSGDCYCVRNNLDEPTCSRCEGRGLCHVCSGTGDV